MIEVTIGFHFTGFHFIRVRCSTCSTHPVVVVAADSVSVVVAAVALTSVAAKV